MLSICKVTSLVILSLISVRCDTGSDDNSMVKFVQLNIQDSLNSLQKQLNYETSTRLQFDKDLTEMMRLYRVMSGEIERVSNDNAKLKQELSSLMNNSDDTDQLTNIVKVVTEMRKDITDISMKQDKFAGDVQDYLNTVNSQINMLNTTLSSVMPNVTKLQTKKPGDCKEILNFEPNSRSGVYTIFPEGSVGYSVYCDMTTQSGGWTVIQRRINGVLNFDKTWQEYKDGFGDLRGEHWIGNDILHLLTRKSKTLLIRVLGKESGARWKYAMYNGMHVGNETSNYRLTFRQGSYSGNAGDFLNKKYPGPGDHNNMMFTTKDRDNDLSDFNCAGHNSFKGGWWFNACEYGCLNCKYLGTESTWGTIHFKSTWMLIK